MAEQIEGKIYAFSKDRKSISVNGIWLHNFTPLKEDIVKNVNYKITYTTKKSGDTEFNNIKSIVALEVPKLEIKPKQIMTRENLNNELLPKQIPNQTQNTILMNVNNIICKEIELGDYNYTPEELTAKIKKLTNDYLEAYKLL